jgi:hypothetical protein
MRASLQCRGLWTLLAVLGCGGGGGCGPVLSVSTVASAGQQLPSQAVALGALPSHCQIFRQIDNGSPTSCQQLASDLMVVRKATEMLADYAVALDKLAGARDPDVRSSVASLLASGRQLGWRDLSADQASGLAQVAGALVAFFSSQWRVAKLTDVVIRYDRDVQTVVSRIDQILDIETETLTSTQGFTMQMARQVPIFVPSGTLPADTVGALPQPPAVQKPATAAAHQILPHPVSVAAQAALYGLGQWSQAQLEEIARFRAAVKAFGATHAELAKNADRLRDAAVLAQIRNTLGEVIRGAGSITGGK